MTELLGWTSSAILIFTIVRQVWKQWRDGTSRGVSRWFYVGQTATSAGFTAYSALLHSWVFTVTNAVLLMAALVGYAIDRHHRGREAPR